MSDQASEPKDMHNASIIISVVDKEGVHASVTNALIHLYRATAPASSRSSRAEAGAELADVPANARFVKELRTDAKGNAHFTDLEGDYYLAVYMHRPNMIVKAVTVRPGCAEAICLEPRINAQVVNTIQSGDCRALDCRLAQLDDIVVTTIDHVQDLDETIVGPPGAGLLPGSTATHAVYSARLTRLGRTDLGWQIQLPLLVNGPHGSPNRPGPNAAIIFRDEADVQQKPSVPVTGALGVSLTRTETEFTKDLSLWTAIRNGTDAMSFNNYQRFIELLFCSDKAKPTPGFNAQKAAFRKLRKTRFLPFTDTDSYRVLKAATEAFVMVNCTVADPAQLFNANDDNGYLDRRDLPLPPFATLPDAFRDYLVDIGIDTGRVLPYLALIRQKLPDIPVIGIGHDEVDLCVGIIQDKLTSPCLIELIWSYWNEEGMLAQTINSVTRRFQNIRSQVTPDPLANLEIDPLRPLNNLIWGYTQDEQHRLTVNRRNYEYDHHYGLRLQGRAIQQFRPADTRSQFLEGFHHLLRLCTSFYRQDDDTTVKADAFPVLNALKEVHLVMSEGAHNQFGDMPSTARIEMLMQQWLLGRPEFREFLPTRLMVAYPEPWMDRVDAMKKLQGWTDTSIVHFRNLAIFGEQLLLSIRYGAWSEIFEPTQAFNWARFWRPQVQGYIHAYRAATGVDLVGDTGDAAADATLPSLLLQRRLSVQRRIA